MTNSPQSNKSVNPFEKELGIKPFTSRLALLKLVEQGFEYRIIPFSKKRLGITLAELSELININPRTLVRRQKSGRLSNIESA